MIEEEEEGESRASCLDVFLVWGGKENSGLSRIVGRGKIIGLNDFYEILKIRK